MTSLPDHVDASTRPPAAGRPARPQMLSHVAWVTHDAVATADFYENVMGMPLVNAFTDPNVPSTGDAYPFLHFFHRMQDGSIIAWFESPGLPPAPAVSDPAYDIFNHLAMQVESVEAVDAWMPWLHSHGIETIGPVDHPGIAYSLYFRDPINGLRLEVSYPLDPHWNSNDDFAREAMNEWKSMKDEVQRAAPDEPKEQARRITEMIQQGRARRPGHEGSAANERSRASQDSLPGTVVEVSSVTGA
jgi:catechol 2,3-dioxygenase-like lactoylglutathione lyase family enzyme